MDHVTIAWPTSRSGSAVPPALLPLLMLLGQVPPNATAAALILLALAVVVVWASKWVPDARTLGGLLCFFRDEAFASTTPVEVAETGRRCGKGSARMRGCEPSRGLRDDGTRNSLEVAALASAFDLQKLGLGLRTRPRVRGRGGASCAGQVDRQRQRRRPVREPAGPPPYTVHSRAEPTRLAKPLAALAF